MPSALEDEMAIVKAYSRYEQAVPERRYDVMASIFAEDAHIENRLGTADGRATIEKRFEARFADAPITKIYAGNHLVEVQGGEARSSADYIVYEMDPASPVGFILKQMGRYHDSWRRENGTWLIYNRLATEPS
jgi:hypothetical protein